MNRKQEYIVVFLIFICAFFSRIYFLEYNQIISTDGSYYIDIAENIIEERGFVSDYLEEISYNYSLPHFARQHPPLFPVLISIFFYFFGISFFSAKMVSVLFGSLMVFAIFYLAKELFSRTIAIFSALVAIVYEPLIRYSVIVGTEVTFSLFILLSVLFFIRALKNENHLYPFLCAISLLLATLTRIQGLLIILVFFLAYMITLKNRVFEKHKKFWILFSIYIIFNIFFLSLEFANGVNNFQFTIMRLTPIRNMVDYETFLHSPELLTKTYSKIVESPIEILLIIMRNFSLTITSILFLLLNPVIYAFSIFGFILLLNRFKDYFLIYTVIFIHFFISSVRYEEASKFLIPVVPFFIISSIFGIYEMFKILRKRKIKNYIVNSIAIFLTLFLSAIILFNSFNYIDDQECFFERDIGTYLQKFTSKNSVISSPYPEVAYYAKTRWITLPFCNYSCSLSVYEKYNVSYVVLYDDDFIVIHPDIEFLLYNDKINGTKNLQLLRESENPKYRIYKIINYETSD